jgi:hypothetical protein
MMSRANSPFAGAGAKAKGAPNKKQRASGLLRFPNVITPISPNVNKKIRKMLGFRNRLVGWKNSGWIDGMFRERGEID